MEVFQVGGSVRDEILGVEAKDKDWVVVGGSEKKLLNAGFRRVGKHFPVFLHPSTREEYALARTERKEGSGHTGFLTDISQSITLKEDLARRDFTVNAIAKNSEGKIIDPFGGISDIKGRILRHITDSFVDDPLRILRAARFSATLGFSLAPETNDLMTKMVTSGELKTLSVERIEKEFRLALAGYWSCSFFQTLKKCHAISQLFPEIDLPEIYNEETGLFRVLRKYAGLEDKSPERYAIFCSCMANYTSENSSGERTLTHLINRLKVSKNTVQISTIYSKFYKEILGITKLNEERILDLFNAMDAFRKPQQVTRLTKILETANDSLYFNPALPRLAQFTRSVLQETEKITAKSIFSNDEISEMHHSEITARLRKERLKKIRFAKIRFQNDFDKLDKKQN